MLVPSFKGFDGYMIADKKAFVKPFLTFALLQRAFK
jgi:hypothetical protein